MSAAFDIAPPRLLLVEDDPTSQAFLAEALRGMPAQVDACADIASAVRHATASDHALWLVDAHLPDGDGADCLRALRSLPDRQSTPGLAITAGASRQELDALCAAGFLEVLMKPVSIALLQGTVQRLIGGAQDLRFSVREPAPGKLAVWDEARALAAIGGNTQALLALRRMFLDELPTTRQALLRARQDGDDAALRACLHKLKAGAGFVGAARLGDAIERMGAAPDEAAFSRLMFGIEDALAWQAPQD